jgi:hypothetical protein
MLVLMAVRRRGCVLNEHPEYARRRETPQGHFALDPLLVEGAPVRIVSPTVAPL